jgi:predicted nucleotidyltransferase
VDGPGDQAQRPEPVAALPALSDAENACVARFVGIAAGRLGERLVEIRAFGSAARGDMWRAHSPMHSDIDLLLVTTAEVPEREQEGLLDQTYPLYLECGRQISPHPITRERLAAPDTERTRALVERLPVEAVLLWRRTG